MFTSKSIIALIVFSTALASANTKNYICVGLDEAPGYAIVNATPDLNQELTTFGHVNGAEVRLSEKDGSLSLTLKLSDKKISTVVTTPGKILLNQADYNEGKTSYNVSCIAQ